MNPLNVYTDIKAAPELLTWLEEKLLPHKLLLPSQPGDSVLAEAPNDPLMGQADILFGQPKMDGVLGASQVKWVQVSSAGFTRYDTPEFRKAAQAKGLVLTNSSAVYDRPCAEHVFSFMLAQCRQLPFALGNLIPNGRQDWLELRGKCRTLQGQSVLIVGYGAIAEELVTMLRPFNVEITAVRRQPRGDEGVKVITPEQLNESLATADHVVNILPENAASRGFFSKEQFDAMKRGAVFYNIGRGTTVDQAALETALRNGPLAAAWLDVTDPEPLPADHPLLQLPNCHVTPHIAGGHDDEFRTIMQHFLDNLERYVQGKPLVNQVI
ncbi:MAG: D-2-hydroxyacid dehydrogenase [Verrucomicrobium sp.]|nr:D-2-hydroxyacid dehydrogenase [Verrucomicrobium sp.]